MALSPFQVALVMAHAHCKLIGSYVDGIRLFNIYNPQESLRIRRNGWTLVVVSFWFWEGSHIRVSQGSPWLEIPQ